MHPLRMHRPPSRRDPSITATRFPSAEATRAALKPADPPPSRQGRSVGPSDHRPFCISITWMVFRTMDASSMNEKLRI